MHSICVLSFNMLMDVMLSVYITSLPETLHVGWRHITMVTWLQPNDELM